MAKSPEDYFEKKAFVFYFDWESVFDFLNSETRSYKLIRALLAFAKRGEIADFGDDEALAGLFLMMSMQIGKDCAKWVETRRRRIEGGKKGGHPKKGSEVSEAEAVSEEQTASAIPKDPVLEGQLFFGAEAQSELPEEKPPKVDRRKRYQFGQYGNVKLTMPKYEKLISDFGDKKTAEYIRRVDEYVQQRGKPYVDYDVTIRKWIREDSEKETAKSEQEEAKKKANGENASLPPPEELEKMIIEKVTKKDLVGTSHEVSKEK